MSVRTKAKRRERKSIILLHSQPKGRVQSSFARHGRNHKRKRGEMNNPVLSCDENRGFAILHVAETNAIQRDSISVTVSSYGHSLGRKSEWDRSETMISPIQQGGVWWIVLWQFLSIFNTKSWVSCVMFVLSYRVRNTIVHPILFSILHHFKPPWFQKQTQTNNYSLLLNTERGKNRITLRITSPFHTYLQNIVDTPLRPLGETLLSDAYIKQEIQTNLKCNCSQDEWRKERQCPRFRHQTTGSDWSWPGAHEAWSTQRRRREAPWDDYYWRRWLPDERDCS